MTDDEIAEMRLMGIDETVIQEKAFELNNKPINVYSVNMVAVKAFVMCDIKFQIGMGVAYTGISKAECMDLLREMGFSGKVLIDHLLRVMILSSRATEMLNNRVKR